MKIEEAIQHCREVAAENRRCALEFARVHVYDSSQNCQECAEEHEQLAGWLDELKQRRETEVKRGRWETINPLYANVYCSECGAAVDKHLAKRYKGCPFCLCVMDSTDTNVCDKEDET